MTVAGFLFAVFALLSAPGPTNTLMALAGAQNGWRRAARLIPAEILGYTTTILPLAWLGAAAFARWPHAAQALKAAAALWVLYLAIRLWKAPAQAGAAAPVTPGRVYVTTVLNPKAFVVGLIFIPAPAEADFLPRLGLFFLAVPLIAAVWSMGGAMAAGQGSARRTLAIQRAASVCLTVLSGTLIAAVLRA